MFIETCVYCTSHYSITITSAVLMSDDIDCVLFQI